MMTQFIKKHQFLLLAILLALITRLFFLGSSLWHNDAVDFANSAVHLAATGEYLPAHAPDYPFWVILLALVQKIAFLLTGHFSPIFPANCLTALLGVLTIIFLFFLTKNLTGQNQLIAFLASLALIFHPAFWLYNEIALSDTAAVFLIVLTLFFFERYLKQKKLTSLVLCGFTLSLAGLTRIPNLLFCGIIPLLFIINNIIERKKISLYPAPPCKALDHAGGINWTPLHPRNQPWYILEWCGIKNLILFAVMIIIVPFLSNLLIYGLIHHWDFIDLLSVSRRVSPSFADLGNTFVNFFNYSLPLFFILYLIGLIRLIFKKHWYLLAYSLLPTILYFYYYAGWFKNGAFDLDRYLLILAPFIALGSGFGVLIIIKLGFPRLSVISTDPEPERQRLVQGSGEIPLITLIIRALLIIIIGVHLFLIILNLFSLKTCQKIKEAHLFNLIFPSTYCQINNYHFFQDDKLFLFQTLNQILPNNATVVVGPDEWAYPQFFGNNYGLGNRMIYKLPRADAESLDLIKNILIERSPIFLPHIYISAKLLDLIEQQNWQLTVIQPSAKIMILKISQ